jgi:branched-chain amino acid transport system substrate-binding protein
MWRKRGNALAILLLVGMIVAPRTGDADEVLDAGTSDTDIGIGNIMPYTGLLAAFATIGKAEAAYFDMVNDNGGINGRKVRFISYDDSSDPATAIELTRKLVETDKVRLMFGSFGTPSNLATRSYLNDLRIPQLFVASGDNQFANPKAFG